MNKRILLMSDELNFKKLSRYLFKNHRNSSLILLFIFFISSILESFSIATLIPIISVILNKDLENNSLNNLLRDKMNLDLSFLFSNTQIFFIVALMVYFIRMSAILYCNWSKEKFSLNVNYLVVNKIYSQYINLSFRKFIQDNSSVFLRKIHYDASLFSSAITHSLTLIFEVLILISITLILIFFNWKLSLILGFISLIILYAVNIFTKKKITILAAEISKNEKKRYQNCLESFNLFKEIRLFNAQNYFLQKNKKISYNFFYNDFLRRFLISTPRTVLEFLVILGLILFIFLIKNTQEPIIILEILTLLGLAIIRLFPAVSRIIASLQSLKSCGPSTNSVLNDLDNNDEFNNENEKGKIEIKTIHNHISLIDVNFRYETTNKQILKKFNFKFNKGKIYGIKGQTGSGKTTLITIVCGLINPQEGEFLIDDINSSKIKTRDYQKLIGYVPQNIFLMDASIEENILFGANEVSEKELKNAVNQAYLTDYVNSSSEGIKTIVGEKSNKISGGQNQRIGIARALLKEKEILIFDEVTNSLDHKAEQKILENIKKLKRNKIILLISHNAKNFEICDEILSISNN